MSGLIIDLFAGAGGASRGIEAAIGRHVDYAVNHDPLAIAMHAENHPDTEHLTSDVWEVEPTAVTRGRPVDVLWASPDCKHFSKAKGGRPVSKRVRSLAWVVIKWARETAPAVIFLENVEEFSTWGPLGTDGRPCPRRKGKTFRRWVAQLQRLGYAVEWRELVAADYGTPTTRKRLFLVARRDGRPIRWPTPTHAPRKHAAARGLLPWRAAAECIDFTIPCPSIFTRRRPLADATQRRIAHGIVRYVINNPEPFIVPSGHSSAFPTLISTGYGERPGQAPRVPGLQKPLGTIVGSVKHALVLAWLAKHYGGVVGHGLQRPIGTITSVDHHSLVVSSLSHFYTSNTAGGRSDPREPLRTLTTANHAAEVRAFLTAWYGNERDGRDASDPLGTITTKDRFGLVNVAGVDYAIVDIGMRMLSPAELLRAQFGRFAEGYTLIGTKGQQVRGIGNSVCPEVAEAIVRVNHARAATRAEAAA